MNLGRHRTRLSILLGIPAVIVLLTFVAAFVIVAASRQKLAAYKSKLLDRGETLETKALATWPSASVDNETANFLAATEELKKTITSKSIKPFAMGAISANPGEAEIAHRRHSTRSKGENVPWTSFEATMKTLQEPLSSVREAAAHPIRIRTDYTAGFATSEPFVTSLILSAQFLSAEAILCLREGKTAQAVDDVRTLLRLSEIASEQPSMVCQLTAASIALIAFHSTWDILQADAAPADLERLQERWQSLNPLGGLSKALRMERAWTVEIFATPDSVFPPKQQFPSNLAEAKTMGHAILWSKFFRYGEELSYLKIMQELLEYIANDDLKGALQVSARLQKDPEANSPSSPLSKLVLGATLPSLSKFSQAAAVKQLCVTAIALRRYQLDHDGKLPELLQELVPAYLPEPPKDAIDGAPLRYRRAGETFTLYSVGQNGVDDGGDPKEPPSKKRNPIFGGADIVWPRPVTPATSGSEPGTPPASPPSPP